ncbi:MAG: hypothetical protein J5950_05370 [Clostridia bacterium]|nr:hypothetical protein [Clostridia bacterium]
MISLLFGSGTAVIDSKHGTIASMKYKDTELACGTSPLFRVCLRKSGGEAVVIDASGGRLNALAVKCGPSGETVRAEAVYGFENGTSVSVKAEIDADTLNWRADTKVPDGYVLEWIELPAVTLKPLNGEGGEASVLFPFNEGAIVDSIALKEATNFRSWPIEYPSLGSFQMFPNMICSQFQAYLMPGYGLYTGAHDPERGLKYIDFTGNGGGVELHMRIYPASYGENGTNRGPDFPVVWKFFEGGWEDAADIYRAWFESALPEGLNKISENPYLPDWYFDMPFVVSYPVRGIHDMDEMKPNALFPYTNALGLIDDIEKATAAKLLVLLMHWEGTAPWAPPYVWPPYGGEENFTEFRDELHKRGDLLGVYCSGFSYTVKSNLNDYSREEEFEKKGLEKAMCAGPDGKVLLSRICPGQRAGYDLCAASEEGDKILAEAYTPLFRAGLDYAQILDQNHGGGQYLCYSSEHGHPPVPGQWMTENMRGLLSRWKEASRGMLLGCESSAAEPYISNLPFSDNRFELNWYIGRPVPLCSYIYHEYMHNFMGNQVSSPFYQTEDSLFLRLAYSFAAGDCLTVVLTPDGRVLDHWGGRDFSTLPDRDEVFAFVKNLTEFAKGEAHEYLCRGRRIKTPETDCPAHEYRTAARAVSIPDVFSAAYTLDGKSVQIFVNHTRNDVSVKAGGKDLVVPARQALSEQI